jgi:SAM-dependent methyltransferase
VRHAASGDHAPPLEGRNATDFAGIATQTWVAMLERARADTTAASVEYRCHDPDQIDLAPDSADVVFSSLTLHHVHDLDRLASTVAGSLARGGSLVFSVEHPILSAPTAQEFQTAPTVSGSGRWTSPSSKVSVCGTDSSMASSRSVARWPRTSTP